MCWSRLWYGIVRPLQYVVNAHAGERANGMTFVAVAKINFRIVDKIRFHGAENDEILFFLHLCRVGKNVHIDNKPVRRNKIEPTAEHNVPCGDQRKIIETILMPVPALISRGGD